MIRGVVCRKCGSSKLRVTNTEPIAGGAIRRRRTCEACGHRLVTFERPAAEWAKIAAERNSDQAE